MTGIDLGHVILALAALILAFVKGKDRRGEGLVNSALSLLAPLQAEIETLKLDVVALGYRVADLEVENGELWQWGRRNQARVLELGGDPAPLPILGR